MTPNGPENEEELNENASKWQNSAHHNARQRLCIEDLVGNGARDCIGADGVLNGALLVAVEGAQEGQGDADAEPHEQDDDQRGEGNRRRRALAPQDQVHDEVHAELEAIDEESGEQDIGYEMW